MRGGEWDVALGDRINLNQNFENCSGGLGSWVFILVQKGGG